MLSCESSGKSSEGLPACRRFVVVDVVLVSRQVNPARDCQRGLAGRVVGVVVVVRCSRCRRFRSSASPILIDRLIQLGMTRFYVVLSAVLSKGGASEGLPKGLYREVWLRRIGGGANMGLPSIFLAVLTIWWVSIVNIDDIQQLLSTYEILLLEY